MRGEGGEERTNWCSTTQPRSLTRFHPLPSPLFTAEKTFFFESPPLTHFKIPLTLTPETQNSAAPIILRRGGPLPLEPPLPFPLPSLRDPRGSSSPSSTSPSLPVSLSLFQTLPSCRFSSSPILPPFPLCPLSSDRNKSKARGADAFDQHQTLNPQPKPYILNPQPYTLFAIP